MDEYTVVSIGYATPSILSIMLEQTELGKPFTYLPGQYAAISFANSHRWSAVRCFSISSSPLDQDRLEFGIRVGGRYTKALTELKAGDLVKVIGPFGKFIFDQNIHKNIVMCAGGIGITPFMSMIRYASTLKLDNKITLIVSARSKEEIPYFQELQSLVQQNKHLSIIYVVDGDKPELASNDPSKIYTGRITEEVLNDASEGNFVVPVFFLCGPPPFMKGVSEMLTKAGADSSNIVTETFSQGQSYKTGNTRNWPSTIYIAGAFGAVISSMIITTKEIVQKLPPNTLKDSLTTEQSLAVSGRQQDIDALVNKLEKSLSTGSKSPAVVAAEKEVADAKSNTSNAGSTSTTSSSTTTTPTTSSPPTSTPTPAPTPKPAPPAPVCTTSASGVTTCQ